MRPTSISQFIDHHYRHFNAAAMKDAAHALPGLLGPGRENAGDPGRCDEHGGIGLILGGNDSPRQSSSDLLHGSQS
jgi:hypothetical protein